MSKAYSLAHAIDPEAAMKVSRPLLALVARAYRPKSFQARHMAPELEPLERQAQSFNTWWQQQVSRYPDQFGRYDR